MTGYFNLDDAKVRWDDRRNRVRQIKGDFLVAPTQTGDLPAGDAAVPAAVDAAGSAVAEHADQGAELTEQKLKDFLVNNGPQLGMDLRAQNLECTQDLRTPTGRVVRYRELRDGIPVHGTEVVVRLGRRENVRQVDLLHEADTPVAEVAGDEPGLTSSKALRTALAAVGGHTLRGGETPRSERLFYPTAEGLKLAYRVLIPTLEPMHDWQIMIDAQSGEVLDREDLMVRMPDGEALVFDPNPVVTANDGTLRGSSPPDGWIRIVATERPIDVPQGRGPDFAVVMLLIGPVASGPEGHVERIDLGAPEPAGTPGGVGEDPILEELSLESAAVLGEEDASEDVAEAFAHGSRFPSASHRVGGAPTRNLIAMDGMAVLV